MRTVGAREANQCFSKLLRAVAQGEEITITRRGRPIARLVPSAGDGAEMTRLAALQRVTHGHHNPLDGADD